jgi:transposase
MDAASTTGAKDAGDAAGASPAEAKGASDAKGELRGSVIDVLTALLAGRRDSDVVALVTKLVERNRELELLLAKLRQSKNHSERILAGQLDLFLSKLKEQTPEGTLAEANQKLEDATKKNGGRPEQPKPPKQPSVRRPLPPALRRVDNPISVPESERPCPVCGTLRRCIAHETTPVIDLIPAEVIVRNDIREIIACDKCDAELLRAPMGDKVVAGGAYGARLVGKLVVDKYKMGLPLHRQAEELERLGLSMPISSMADQITWATDLLRPLWRGLIAQVLDAFVLHVDATSLPVRDKDCAKWITLGALWGYVGDTSCAVYLYTSTGKKNGQREGEIGPAQLLAQRQGYIVADASNLFDAIFRSGERIEIGCNMHARRYFSKALDAADMRAAVPVAAFKALYDVEHVVHDADPAQRLEARQQRSKPVYDELIAWCKTYRPLEPPTSLLGKAIQYLLNHQVALTRFLDDGRLPIDNGIVERLHRMPAITRRNFLFAGSHAGGDRAAIAYSILASCDLADVNPVEYLADMLPRLARDGVVLNDVPVMLPAAWKKAREAAATAPSPSA